MKHQLSIEYCAAWNYLPQAVRVTESILADHASQIEAFTLLPSRGGVFEVTLDGELVYSKKETKRHATLEELHEAIGPRLSPAPWA